MPETRRDTVARRRRQLRRRRTVALALFAVVVVSGGSIAAGALADGVADADPTGSLPATSSAPLATSLPVPQQVGVQGDPAEAGEDGAAQDAPPENGGAGVCDDPDVAAALTEGTDADVVAAMGGAEVFREAVAAGTAPCIDLSEADRSWVVVDKLRPLMPIDYVPDSLHAPDVVATTRGLALRADAADALTRLVATAAEEGAGSLGLNSAYRSYGSQVRIHDGYVRRLGQEAADETSARPGYSEHQTGLAADVVACTPACGTLRGFGGTVQADWVAENAWRFGFIVRYEQGHTETTGYEWEPWHVRYIGDDLARVYRDGGYDTLEAFFGLPAAPSYE